MYHTQQYIILFLENILYFDCIYLSASHSAKWFMYMILISLHKASER